MPILVNGVRIDDDEIEREFYNIKSAYHTGIDASCCSEHDDEYQQFARQSVISRALLLEVADARGVSVEAADVDQALEELKEQHGGEEWFYMAENADKQREPEIKSRLEANLRVQKVLDEQCPPPPEPTEEQIQAFYEQQIDQFMTDEQVKASHIVKNLDHGEDRVAAFKALMELRAKLMDEGADFAALSDEHSDRPGEGGDLGFFSRGELVEEFETVAFSMRPGEISPVFLSPFGYHLITVTDRKAPTPKPLAEVRSEVVEMWTVQTQREQIQAYIDQLKAQATIEDLDDEADDEEGDEAVDGNANAVAESGAAGWGGGVAGGSADEGGQGGSGEGEPR